MLTEDEAIHALQALKSLRNKTRYFTKSSLYEMNNIMIALQSTPPLTDTAIDLLERLIHDTVSFVDDLEDGE
jgi:hypothetical protein